MKTATSRAMAMIATHSMALRTGPLCFRWTRRPGGRGGAGSGSRGASSTVLVGRPEKKGSALTVGWRLLGRVTDQDAPRCLIDGSGATLNHLRFGTQTEQQALEPRLLADAQSDPETTATEIVHP